MFKKLVLICVLFALGLTANATVYTINSLADPGAGVGTAGSLRYCLTTANADLTAGPHYIRAGIAGTITLGANLPAILQSMIIDGRTAPGYAPGAPTLIVNRAGNSIFTAATAINISIWGVSLISTNATTINFQNTLGDTISFCKIEADNATCIVINNAAVTSGYVIQNNKVVSPANTHELAVLTNASDVNISNNTSAHATFVDAIVINSTVSNYTISSNTVTACGNFITANTSTITNFTSSNNTVSFTSNFGYNMGTLTTFTISANTVARTAAGGTGVSIVTASTGSILNNNITLIDNGVLFTTTASNVICSNNTLNRVSGGGNYGVKVTAGSNNTINNNVVKFFNNTGIYLSGTNHTFSGNKVTNGTIGINLTAATGCTGITDTVTNHSSYGVLINNSSRNNIFGGTGAGRCIVTTNNSDGVRIDGANINQIINVQIAANTNGSGVHILNSSRLNQVKSCLIGVAASGIAASANANHGVFIETAGANNNTIGGTTLTDGNIISGNSQNGIFLDNNGPDSTKILYNYIGVGSDGTTLVVNGTGTSHHGIRMNSGSPGSVHNVIKNNVIVTPARGCGISIESCSDDTISFNYIGVDATGSTLLGIGNTTSEFGIYMKGTASNEVINNNVVSGSKGEGIKLDGGTFANLNMNNNYIGTDATGLIKYGNGTSTSCHGIHTNSATLTTANFLNNIVAASAGYGVFLDGAVMTNITFKGNMIGMNKNGLGTTFGNTLAGLYMQASGGSSNLIIGGTNVTDRNIISMNGRFTHACASPDQGGGIVLINLNHITMQGNYIGVDGTGIIAAGNGNSGITLNGGCDNVLVGGIVAGAGNILCSNGFFCTGAGNVRHGVQFVNNGSATVLQVFGNYVGIGTDGNTMLGNAGEGVSSFQSPNITVGGNSSAYRNVIGGNGTFGVYLQPASATGCKILGNYIGTDATGTIAKPNGSGVQISLASANVIGGPNPGEGNVISGNTSHGIVIDNADNTFIQQNYIGTKADGSSPLPNGADGIRVQQNGGNGATGVFIGTTTLASLKNVIAFNVANGINIVDALSQTIQIRRNSIFCNGTTYHNGINLNGVGNTNILISPLISISPYITAPNPGITPTFTNQAGLAASDVIEVFQDDGCGTCQGRTYLGDATALNTPAAGDWTFAPLPASADCSPKGVGSCLSGINNITATRTSIPAGNTSEFMACDPIPLPINLISFTAKKYSSSDVLIQWATASEKNNAYFELLRGTDGKTFSPIAQIEGYGNSNNINNYDYVDENLAPGIYYYMLIQVDFNGKQTPTQIVAVNTANQNNVEIVPTAVNAGDPIRILNFTGLDLVSVSLVDINGKNILERSAVSGIESTISTAGFASGMYLVKIQTGTDLQVKKILVY